jgi:hypothetical protein
MNSILTIRAACQVHLKLIPSLLSSLENDGLLCLYI